MLIRFWYCVKCSFTKYLHLRNTQGNIKTVFFLLLILSCSSDPWSLCHKSPRGATIDHMLCKGQINIYLIEFWVSWYWSRSYTFLLITFYIPWYTNNLKTHLPEIFSIMIYGKWYHVIVNLSFFSSIFFPLFPTMTYKRCIAAHRISEEWSAVETW